MAEQGSYAPGWPGIPARWTSSAKQGIGSSHGPASRVWFTLSHGIFNEIYYPRVDRACTRDMGMFVTGQDGFFSEEKRHTTSEVSLLAPGVPGYLLRNTCARGRYRIQKEIVTDPLREVLLQHTRFTALQGELGEYQLYVLLAPHIGNRGAGNTAWLDSYKGTEMLFAERDGTCLALACSAPWLKRSVGFVGVSDGWQDISRNGRMSALYERAENGNVALAAQIDISACGGECVLALGFGSSAAEAGNRARASLSDGFPHARTRYIDEWRQWQDSLTELKSATGSGNLERLSAAVIHSHEAKNFPGGLIASLSIPWGFSKGDDDLGGYHLVWVRDLVETAGGLLAAGASKQAKRVLHYLQSTQEEDGHWPQNMWLDGSPYWGGIQMDEAAFPILLVDLAVRQKLLDEAEKETLWRMAKRAAGFVAKNGPVTQQDRWEEDPGYSPFTLAVEIASLLAAADLAESQGEPSCAAYLRETADAWNDNIERWIYVEGTELARTAGVKGYYVRISPPEVAEASSPAGGFVPIKNRPPGESLQRAAHIVSPDALALVRFGLRAPDDPRILDTVRVIDSLLKVETPFGPAWHRYNDDGYGEHEDGAPFDGIGRGRAWPLITGERGHFELAAGRRAEAEKLCAAIEAFAGPSGLIPEQVWDAPDIPARELFFGRPSGSAMPLLWAHAEYLKLRRSLRDGKVFDVPPQAFERYVRRRTHSAIASWRMNQKCRTIAQGKKLRVELGRPAAVQWSTNGWESSRRVESRPAEFGVHVADLPTERLPPGSSVTFRLIGDGIAAGAAGEYTVKVTGAGVS